MATGSFQLRGTPLHHILSTISGRLISGYDEAAPEPSTAHGTMRLTARIRRYFFAGLATLFPVAVTLYALVVVFKFADGLLGRFINRHWLATYGYEIPGLGLVMTVILLLVVGFLSSQFFGQWMVRRVEGWFGRLPIIRHVYNPVKQLTKFLFEQTDRPMSFHRVVLVPYPRVGSYSIGFVTNESVTTFTGASKTLLTVLVSTPPSPFTGPIIFVPKEDVVPLNMSVEDAVKLVMSGGVVAPPLEAVAESSASS